ncbi:Excinuclease ABC, C subunit domain protein [Alkaliphilus metalliredigens QYMF]|uniref:Excinuclease ABC, C subunit domain protein n=2 Tax=Alkaliphilus TaxID=114627 RepID=A6TPB7_ALKMQ|nr:Excinuclease ABC, C subunit domain protein [Alkaliphilus metalliredigens QYMF]
MYYVYMLTNWNNKVLYTGVTNNLERRIYEHKNKLVKGFTAKYNVGKLVYFDYTSDVISAIAREKEIKGWARKKKNELIESINPQWNDLSKELFR